MHHRLHFAMGVSHKHAFRLHHLKHYIKPHNEVKMKHLGAEGVRQRHALKFKM